MSERPECVRSVENCLHVHNRGVDRNLIFFHPSDCERFMGIMKESQEEIPLRLLVFTLMPNHFHIVVQQDEPYAVSA